MEENRNIDREIALEKKIKQLDNIIFKRGQSAQTVHMMTKSKICLNHSTKQAIGFEKPFYLKKVRESKPKLYDGNVILKMDAIVILDSDETLMLCEESRSKMLLKEQDPMVVKHKVNTKPINYAILNNDYNKRFVRQSDLYSEHAYWKATSVPPLDPSPSSTTNKVEVPKDFQVDMVYTSLKELNAILLALIWLSKKEPLPQLSLRAVGAVEQHRLESRTFEVKMNQVLSENERLLAQAIDHDIVKTVVNLSVNDETYDKLCKSFTTLEKHCITLEADSQLNQEIFQQKNSVLDQNAPSFTQLFELSELRAQSQEKDTVIVKLKEQIKSLKGNVDEVVQIVLWYLDSGCSKHMTGDRSQLTNFISKFLGTVKFGNDQVAKIMGYGDYQIGNVTISRVYYVEGLGHNLFCDSNLEVAFRQHTCFIRNLEGVDLLTGSRGDNLYTLSLGNMMASSPICLLSKASKTKSWLWHRRLSHLNFGAINHLARHGLVRGLPKLKFENDHLCSACALGKSSKKPHKPKSEDTNQEKLYLLHMDLCSIPRSFHG
ncbi:retrovirus-related pol polyprotein from transposon TNT 1-94 [Tanacetum coccineum]